MSTETTDHAALIAPGGSRPHALGPLAGEETGWSPAIQNDLRRYVSHRLFRAATYDELVIDDNPFRRPVRPDDLEWLKFEEPVTETTFGRLSSLLGNRMLRNVLDADRPGVLAPRTWSDHKRRDAEEFHSVANREAGRRVRPFLERHLFGFLDGSPPLAPDSREEVTSLARARSAAARTWGELLAQQGPESRRMMVIQLLGPALAARAVAAPTHQLNWVLEEVEQLARSLDLTLTPHAYWQFYLPTTLALANQLDRDTHDSSRWRDGVLTAFAVDAGARLAVLADVPLQATPDVTGGAEFLRGLRETAALLNVVTTDLTRQLELVGGTEHNEEKARRLYDGIHADQVDVDLDTFVESWEECSTAHVHDDDRLVVIESGEMVFWTCVGQEIRLREGQMTFVPEHRLHGSVVLSGTCTYHQPIITADLARRYC